MSALNLQIVMARVTDIVYTDHELEKLLDNKEYTDIVSTSYGAVPLTPKVLQEISNKKVYGLTGQALLEMKNRDEKVKRIESFIVHPTNNPDEAIIDYYDNDSYEIYLYEGIFRTGSGADPVYVYV